ncbi:Acriflavin resistance protein [Parvularcula bermudensis HTCC2503]|uniref:Acriflavin resistance protein n=1 Tax=Parvularcula bermudensis (strain ATCC BAA-594 / HTCC2503 / KCTC 12087) TaxID=314260 RepID=E0TIK3_PARBH|nr:efflux RND transporter permease subunit [Parvularcula bermudensis]ADM10861.1 Acriflavin resistance protein [Parvularcula bermudensis HTCC2503]
MIQGIISTALKLRFITVALAIALVVFGVRGLGNAPLDVFPEFAAPLVEIQTEAPGLSALEVEELVTAPLENAVNGVAWLDTIRSKSVLGLSSVKVIFDRNVDLMEARQLVQERVALATPTLPTAARAPVLLSPLSSTSRVLKIGMQSDTLSQMELSTLAVWTVRPRLMSVPGVANVAVWGQRDREFQIVADPTQLSGFGLTIDDLRLAASNAVAVTGGSFVEGANQRLSVTHVPAVQTTEDLERVLVSNRGGMPIRMGDVARVVEGSPPPIGDAIVDGAPGILLIVEKQPWGNTLDVTRGVEAALDDLMPALEGVRVDPTIFRPATYIENSIANLNHALLIGCGLVIVVLLLFLSDWRSALISITAIPLSLLTAALVLQAAGGVINTMVLAGLVIALGEVVDDAIIDVENIVRRLRLNAETGFPRSSFAVVRDASTEVRSAVVFGSLLVAAALVPVFTLTGLTGTFFKPLALTYITAIGASLAVALTVTPALALLLLPRNTAQQQRDSRLVRTLKSSYEGSLKRLLFRPRAAMTALGLSVAAACAIYPFLGQELLPKFREYDFLMHWLERPGTSLPAMNRITMRASDELQSVDGVRNFGAHVGRAEVADEVVGIDFTELWISLDPEVDYEAKVEELQAVVDGYPGLYRDLLTYLRERIKEVLTGTSASIVVRISGPDLDTLISKAAEVEEHLAQIDGAADVHAQHLTYVPEIEVEYRPDAGAALGITPADVRRATSTLLSGERVGQIYADQIPVNVVIRGPHAIATSFESLRELRLMAPNGDLVPLTTVANVTVQPSPNGITRENASRRIDVSVNAVGRPVGAVAQDVEAALAGIVFEQGYFPELLGEYAELSAARSTLFTAMGAAFIAIFLILHALFGSVRVAIIIIACLGGALFGGVLGALIGGGVVSLGSLIGFVTVLGIAARTSVMMISHFRHLEEVEDVPFGPDLVAQGAEERLAPILMTACTTGLALLPLIVGGVKAGQEIEYPMAIVILSGLAFSVLVNLLLLPPLYLRFGRRPERSPEESAPLRNEGVHAA